MPLRRRAQRRRFRADEVAATLEKLHELMTKGILTQDEFNAKKAELLGRLA